MPDIKTAIYWTAGGLALVALAGPYPELATGFLVLIIAGLVLTHWQDYTSLIQPPGAGK